MNTKSCRDCNEEKPLNEFRSYNTKKGIKYRAECLKCERKYGINYYKEHIEEIKIKREIAKPVQKIKQQEHYQKIKKERRWELHLRHAKERCNNPNNSKYSSYGGKGIKCYLTKEEAKKIWERDKAWNLVKPSIDRIENDGNYTFDNCQFIENIINSQKDQPKQVKIPKEPKIKPDKGLQTNKTIFVENINGKERLFTKAVQSNPILQYDLENNLIKEWVNYRIAANDLNLTPSKIEQCLKGKIEAVYGFKWKYKSEVPLK